jgi:DNA-directed RNA polymerase specialized sigma24 family protein
MESQSTTMTKDKLEQLIDLRAEIRELDRKMSEFAKKDTPVVNEKVKASWDGYPYTEGRATISGHDEKYERRMIKEYERLNNLRMERRMMATELVAEIEGYINGIESSRVRLMFQYRYVDGFKLEKVGELMHCDRTTVEKTISRYLKENP